MAYYIDLCVALITGADEHFLLFLKSLPQFLVRDFCCERAGTVTKYICPLDIYCTNDNRCPPTNGAPPFLYALVFTAGK